MQRRGIVALCSGVVKCVELWQCKVTDGNARAVFGIVRQWLGLVLQGKGFECIAEQWHGIEKRRMAEAWYRKFC